MDQDCCSFLAVPGQGEGNAYNMSHAIGQPFVHMPDCTRCVRYQLVRLMGSFFFQVVSSVSMVPGGSRESWPCLDPWGIIH